MTTSKNYYSCSKCQGDSTVTVTNHQFHDIYHCTSCGLSTITQIGDCCREAFTVVVKDQSKGLVYFIRSQCIKCGGCLDMTKPLPVKLYGEELKGEFEKHRFNEWKRSVQDERTMLYNQKKACDIKNSYFYRYLIYLSSDEWKAKRLLVLERDRNLCQKCKQKPAEEVHHLTYDNLGNEPLEDLLSVCKVCHLKLHRKG